MKIRVVAKLGALVAVAAGGLLVAPSAAQAAGCDAGDACVYNYVGELIYDNPGNVTGIAVPASSGFVWNNGVADPGQDHIQLDTTWNGRGYTICLHYGAYNPDGDGKTVATLSYGEVVNGWTWRGECSDSNWHYR